MTLPEALSRLRTFRQSFEEGEIDEESGLSTGDLDMVLSVLELQSQAKCGTCGREYSLSDPEAIAYHDQEMHT